MLSEGLSVSSYDIAEEQDFVVSDTDQPSDQPSDQPIAPIKKEMLELKMGKVKDMREYQYTESQLLKYWYKVSQHFILNSHLIVILFIFYVQQRRFSCR